MLGCQNDMGDNFAIEANFYVQHTFDTYVLYSISLLKSNQAYWLIVTIY